MTFKIIIEMQCMGSKSFFVYDEWIAGEGRVRGSEAKRDERREVAFGGLG